MFELLFHNCVCGSLSELCLIQVRLQPCSITPLIAVIKPHRSCANVPQHWRYPFLPTASAILEEVNLESLLEDYFYAEARALAISRLETSATRGIIDIEGPPTNDENDIVLGYVISRLVLAATDNQALVNYVALSEARRAESHLSSS